MSSEKDEHSFQIPRAPPIRKLFSSMNSEDDKANTAGNDTFKVFLRIKPHSELNNSNTCVSIRDSGTLLCKPPPLPKFKKIEKVEYSFSHIFGPKTTQAEIFSECVVSCVEDLLLARSSLIFAYGTTNAGKTYTVQGSAKNPGIIPQALHTLFCNIKVDQNASFKPYLAKDILHLQSSTSQKEMQIKDEIVRSFRSSTKSVKSSTLSNDSSHFMQALKKSLVDLKRDKPACSVWISFLEVYNETIYDLLDSSVTSRKPLKMAADQNDNFYVKGLKQIYVSTAEEAFAIYQIGKRNLNIASTKVNENSSRSHCIFTIYVINLDMDDQPVTSKLCICDLAGSERLTKTQNTGLRLKESGNINGSLFQLNRCLRAIRENQTKHTKQLIPYRHSNLTKLLHSALDDRTDEKSIMIVNINPAAELFEETQQVLKMSAIASKIQNRPIMKPLQSRRFSTFIYGQDIVSMDGGHNYEQSDFENNTSKETDDLYIQDLNEKLMRQEEEINRLNEHVKIRENYHENTKKNLKEYCEKIEATYKSRVKSLEERLKSQKEYYLWKVAEVQKNTLLESISDEAIREELLKKEALIEELEKQLQDEDDRRNSSIFNNAHREELLKKDAQIEELEKKLLESQHDDQCRNFSFSEEIQEKNVKIEELELLIEEVKKEYLSLEKKYASEVAKANELENELSDKNEIIERFENLQNAKQNMIEEFEQKIEDLEERLNHNAVEYEEILFQTEKARDTELAAQKNKIEELNEKLIKLESYKDKDVELALQRDKIEELNEKLIKLESYKDKDVELAAQKDKIEELHRILHEFDKDFNKRLASREKEIEKLYEKLAIFESDKDRRPAPQASEMKELKHDENINRRHYNTRRNNKTPSGKENRLLVNSPYEVEKKSKKNREKPKTPLANLAFDDSLETNVFRNIPEKGTNTHDPPKSEKKKLFCSPADRTSFSSPYPDLCRDYESSKDPNEFVQMATPKQTVKSMKKKK